jgi:hypothetical protein
MQYKICILVVNTSVHKLDQDMNTLYDFMLLGSKNNCNAFRTSYKMGPGQAMLLYTISLYFTLICFIDVESKLYSYLSYVPRIVTILLEKISFSFPILTVCV